MAGVSRRGRGGGVLVLLLLAGAGGCRKSSSSGTTMIVDASAPSPDASNPTPNPDEPDATVSVPDAADVGGVADTGSAVDAGAAPDAPPVPVTTISPCRLLGVGQPTAMDLSPDGKLAVFGNTRGGVTIFSMSPFAALRTITAHPARVGAVAFSRDSARVASGDDDGHVALWDAASGGGLWTATGLRGPIQALAFSPSGTLWALTADGLVAMDASNGTHAAPALGTSASTAAFSEDGSTIALGQADGSFRLLRASDRSTLATVAAAHPGGVTALRISADGARIASGGADGTVALWSAQGSLLRRIAKPGKPVTSVDLNGDGSIVIIGASAYAGAFRADGTALVEYIIFPEYARLSKDGAFLVQMTAVGRVDISPIDPQNPNRGDAWSDFPRAVAFAPDGRLLAESSDSNDVRLWDTETGERVRTLVTTPRIYNPASAIAFSPDGANLARNAGDDTIRVLRVSDSAIVASYRGAKPATYSLAYSPDGQWLATPGPTAVALWRIADGTSGPGGFTGRAGSAPTALAFSKDGTRLAVGDGGGGVSIWAFPSGARVGEFAAGTQPIDGIAFSPDGTRLTVTSFALTALYALDGTQVNDLARELGLSFSSDGAYLATIGIIASDSVGRGQPGVWLRSPATGLPSMRIAQTGDPFAQLFAAAFAPAGHRLAVIGLSSAQILCLP